MGASRITRTRILLRAVSGLVAERLPPKRSARLMRAWKDPAPGSGLVTLGEPPDPLVSVLIPLWNARSYVGECIESILRQTYARFELVIVDDCSTDGSLEIARRFARTDDRISVFENEANIGAPRNMDRCFELAKGAYVKVVCHDDLLEEDALARFVQALRERPDASMAIARYRRIDSEGSFLRETDWTQGLSSEDRAISGKELGRFALSRCINPIGTPTAVMIRRSALGPFEDPYRGTFGVRVPAFDLVRWLQLLTRGNAAFVARPLTVTRVHGDSTTSIRGSSVRLAAAWTDLIAMGKNVGFVDDPRTEFEATISFLIAGIRPMVRWTERRGDRESSRILRARWKGAAKRAWELTGEVV